MKKLLLCACLTLVITGCKEKTEKEDNAVTELKENQMENTKEAEWKVLFDGTSFDGWKGYLQDSVPDVWKLEDGAMVFYPPENRPDGANYNLVTEENFESFELSLEWRIAEGGNSGVFWGVKEDEEYHQPYETGPEVQVLDNEKHPDAKAGTTHQAGALYDMVAPSEDVTKPIGEWNTMVLRVDQQANTGSVTLNGEKIVEFPVGNEEWDAMVADSKFAGWEGFGKFSNGKIGVQDHGDGVAFRNIKIKELN